MRRGGLFDAYRAYRQCLHANSVSEVRTLFGNKLLFTKAVEFILILKKEMVKGAKLDHVYRDDISPRNSRVQAPMK